MKEIFQIDCAESGTGIQPVLNIRTGQHHFSYAITDLDSGLLKMIKYFTSDEYIGSEDVNAVINLSPELSSSFYRVKICFDYPDNMPVTADGFQKDNAGLLKAFNGGYITISDEMTAGHLVNVYQVPADLYDLLLRKFPASVTFHGTTVDVRQIKSVSAHGLLQVDVRHHEFSVFAFRSGKLLFSQTFEYASPEDVIYYLLSICRQYSLSQNEVDLILSGLIEKESALYRDLYQYFINISFREPEWNVTGGEYPLHFFTALNDLAKCE